jgi:16S rRNA (uracil1498-N3)-methyltransferase
MRSFHDKDITPTSDHHTLNEVESKHIIHVLRMKCGEKIALLDGIGGYYICEIINENAKHCGLKVVSSEQSKKPTEEIHIAVCPTKQIERIEWFMEKATEIGITELSLIECANSERTKFNTERLKRKAVSAMKQSQGRYLPIVNELSNFSSFIKNHPAGLIAHCLKEEQDTINGLFKKHNCPILIGPEGDFTEEELQLALLNGYKTVTLGPNRLRTETAALYACMQAKLINE